MFWKKKNKNIWFTRVRGSYLPCSWQGWLIYAGFVAFLFATFYLSFKGGRTLVGQLYFIFPQYVSAAVAVHWLASRFSK